MILTIDLGTTYFKFSLFDRDGRHVRTVRAAPRVESSAEGRLELSAERFMAAIEQGVRDVITAAAQDAHRVEAVSFATQANSFLLLDGRDRALTPIVLWPDERAKAYLHNAIDMVSQTAPSQSTGVPALSSEFMATKLLWFARHESAAWQATARLCHLSDYLTLTLTGEHVVEAGVAGLTGLVDVRTAAWIGAATARFALQDSWLPTIVRAGRDLGVLRCDAARRLGLPPSCRIIVGCLDQYAGAIGVGNLHPGMASETTGTVLAAVTCSDRFDEELETGAFQGPAYRDGLFWRMAFGNVAGNYLHWYREQLPDRPDFAALCAAAAGVAPGAGGLRLDRGQASPADAIGPLIGTRSMPEIVRAILEAVALELREHLALLNTTAGESATQPNEVRAAGGGAASDVWLQIKADVVGARFSRTACSEPTSLGAAILAEGALAKAHVEDVAATWIQLAASWTPDERRQTVYRSWG